MSTQPSGVIPTWTIADRLRKAREVTGMDQREFADHIGISRNTVTNYETGKTTRFSRPMLAAWAMATGVPLEWLEGMKAPHPGKPDEGPDVRHEGVEPPTRWLMATDGDLTLAA
jgi:transcriptional regulator with XRE-family HTH domain